MQCETIARPIIRIEHFMRKGTLPHLRNCLLVPSTNGAQWLDISAGGLGYSMLGHRKIGSTCREDKIHFREMIYLFPLKAFCLQYELSFGAFQ